MTLAFNISFENLYTPSSLKKVDRAFLGFIRHENKEVWQALVKARQYPEEGSDLSALLIAIAPLLERFLAKLFNIQQEVTDNQHRNKAYEDIAWVKRHFLQRHVMHLATSSQASLQDILNRLRLFISIPSTFPQLDAAALAQWEQSLAHHVKEWLSSSENHTDALGWAEQYALWALFQPEGQNLHREGTLFHLPQKTDYTDLISHFTPRGREGFDCTTPPVSSAYAADQTAYCLYCHKQNKDTCSKGFDDHKINPLGNVLAGCPLGQKISEMNWVKRQGFDIGALGIIMVDNPLVPLTGHRICNDCMKACIFQKQEPVDVPSIETQILEQVLNLPWGFEIYSLLAKWNPIKITNYLPRSLQPHKVLVTGLGPSGMGLSYYLLQKGYAVVGIDGLHIEPLSKELVLWDKHIPQFKPIRFIKDLFQPLSQRKPQGFGGVAEYGITARWNKNFLLVVRLLLERHQYFRYAGDTRLQSTLTTDQAFKMGFSHVALCLGAGRPNTLEIPENLASGVRQASDFLMSLHLGAFHEKASIPLMIRLPIVVIGGGLTAVDTATEALAYYPLQVEKFLSRYEILCKKIGKEQVEKNWTDSDRAIATEVMHHAQLLRNYKGNKQDLLKEWGGCTLVYRKAIQQSPAYRLNHHELIKAQEEGVKILDEKVLNALHTDAHGAVQELEFTTGERLKAHTVLVATGTHPNTVLGEEIDGLALDKDFFANKTPDEGFYTALVRSDFKRISLWGDLHPHYSGSVVKALASVKNQFEALHTHLKTLSKSTPLSHRRFFHKIEAQLTAKIVSIADVSTDSLRLRVKAPLQVKNLQLGQFFRVQVPFVKSVALTGLSANAKKGTMDFLIKSTHPIIPFIKTLKKGDVFPLMGPTGSPFPLLQKKNILLMSYGFESLLLKDYVQQLQLHNQVVHLQENKDGGALLKKFQDYVEGKLKKHPFSFSDVHFVYMAAPTPFLQAFLKHHASLLKVPAFVGLSCPMQCMMKEICGQCLQKVRDPVTQEEKIIYACKNQIQPLTWIDLNVLQDRAQQNGVQEKIEKL